MLPDSCCTSVCPCHQSNRLMQQAGPSLPQVPAARATAHLCHDLINLCRTCISSLEAQDLPGSDGYKVSTAGKPFRTCPADAGCDARIFRRDDFTYQPC